MSLPQMNVPRFSLICVLVSLSGCALLPGAQPAPGERVAGILTLESGRFSLRPCDNGKAVAVAVGADIQQLFEQVVPPTRQSVFVDMRARVLAAGGLEPVEVIRLQAAGSGCADPLPGRNQWVALGGLGSADGRQWQVQISPLGMQWQDDAAGSSAAPVPVITEAVPGSAISFQTLRGTPQELWVYPQGCYQPSGGDYAHRTARFTRNGETVTGCAYRGLLP